MPQKTNLNINPYYDDFDPNKNFYRVLFKPGFPVQARELTTLQSIFQHQVESFGSHIFKEGSMVIPGSITYDDQYFSVKINQNHLGIDVTLYIDKLIGKKIIGQTSGTGAVIKNYSIPPQDNVDEITFYVKYLESGNNLEIQQFNDGEILIIQDNIIYGNTIINSGDTIATVLDQNATSIGSAVGVDKGVYFIRGTFVDVPSSTIVVDPYSNTASYRVGFNIFEETVTSDEDNSLNDNARGFSNYAAPGADRFKISTILAKKDLNDFNDTNFIELVKIDNGQIKKIQDKSIYSQIRDYLAKRTYEESGDYAVNGFQVEISNSLNDRIGNGGIYLPNQKTEQGNTPSDDLMCVKVSSGKAYVRGYDIDSKSTIIDVEKPRDTETVANALIPFEMGNLIRVNNVSGTPFVGLGTSGNIVQFYNQRKNSTSSGTGTLIGSGRVYSFSLTDAAYSNASTEWDLYLYDVQTYTVLTLNSSLDSSQCPQSSYIRGVSSGASGYVTAAASGTTLNLTQTSGSFIVGEQILINENLLNTRTVSSVKSYTTDDIKSIYQDSTNFGLKQDFVADSVLYKQIPSGFTNNDRITISAASGGTSTVTSASKSFLGIRSDSIITYQIAGFSTETYNRVVSVSNDGFSMSIVGVNSVFGVCNGGLPTTSQSVPLYINAPILSGNGSLYTPLYNTNISSVNLSNSDIIISTQINNLETNSVGTMSLTVANTGISSAFFEPFDADRYSIFYSDGTIQNLTSDQVQVSSNGSVITFFGLKANQSAPSNTVTLNATLKKRNSQHKIKNYVRSQKVSVQYTSVGLSTSISGLTTSPFYGLRIEDPEISLNVPDVVQVIAVYESLNSSAPVLDKLTFVSGLNLDTQSILGEKIIGSQSGSVAQLVTRLSSTEVEFVYLNSKQFIAGESVLFEESQITSSIQAITQGSYLNISSRYGLDSGHREQYCDYSRIVRSKNFAAPSRQLLIIFDYYEISSGDAGDLVSVNSYTQDRFSTGIPILPSGIRSSDTLDFRPTVSKFTANNASPFSFDSRQFVTPSSYYTIAPNEASIVGYSYYLPRIDRLILNKLGELSVIKGTSSLDAKPPVNVEDAMDIALINLPAYLHSPSDAYITLIDNRRYTMRDIGNIVDRVQTLELTTSLSLLELDTKTLQIQDSSGLNRFKSGFFVDNFRDTSFINFQNSDVKCDVNTSLQELTPSTDFWSLKAELALAPSINTATADFSANLDLLDSNVKKTGDLITLKYNETKWIDQPLASGVENINPFNVIVYAGSIKLTPSSDNWVRNIYLENTRTTSRSYTSTTIATTNTITNSVATTNTRIENQTTSSTQGQDPLVSVPRPLSATISSSSGGIGKSPGSTSVSLSSSRFKHPNSVATITTSGGTRNPGKFVSDIVPLSQLNATLTSGKGRRPLTVSKTTITGSISPQPIITTSNTTSNLTSTTSTNTSTNSTTTSTTTSFPTEDYDYVESIKTTGSEDPYMRSRNVEFRGSSLKPLTQHYAFIDDVSSLDIIPKLVEISMTSGTFQVGENVSGFVGGQKIITFRTSRPDHKSGPYNSPITTYNANPYSRTNSLPTSYSSSSTVLNIDTFSLAEESVSKYGGYLQVGCQLVGETSGAVATVSNIRLISDTFGDLIGTFFIQNPNSNPVPPVRLKTGQQTFKLTASPSNVRSDQIPGSTIFGSSAESTYFGSGIIQTQISNIVQVRNPPPPKAAHRDPLAQSFTVDETGAFLTSVDVYFASKDPSQKMFVELRTLDESERPSGQLVQDYAQVELEPSQIQVSSDASIPTRITFPSPIYLQANLGYALVFICPTSDLYEMWAATMGQKTVNTQNLPNAESVIVSKQYIGGSLFKSQNGGLWTENQYQDLKFTLYKAKFNTEPGDVVFYNPPLRPEESTIPYLKPNAIRTLPRKLRVGITTTTTMSSILTVGRKVSSGSISSPGATGLIENVGGPITSVSIANTGIGYSGGTSGGTYNNVPLYTINGQGSGATATVTITSTGFVSAVSIANTGNGYRTGDTLGITTSNVVKGSGALISVSGIGGIDTLYLSSVQGEEFTNGNDLIYYDGTTAVATANTDIRGSSSQISSFYSGNVFEISQNNYAMHASNNRVQIKNIQPDTVPIQLTSSLGINATTISVASTTPFATFEGISTSRGYVKVNNEIIFYNSIGSGTLGIGTRGVDNTLVKDHASSSLCYKYELNGVSLTRINTTFDMPTDPILVQSKDIDKYYLQFDRASRNAGTSQLSFVDEKTVGGSNITASQNYQYNSILPQFNVITPGKNTTVSAQMRTVSGTSCGGSELSFQDQNYEPVQLNSINFLNTPRLICSEINETTRLTTIPKNKSLTFRIRMNSDDPNLSPAIDLQTGLFVLGRNRVNNPVSDYITDGRVNLITGDPHNSVYISNRVNLQTKATSLKVLVSACRPEGSDFRVLYQLVKADASEIEQSFTLFPGYDNISKNGTFINPSLNSGNPDQFVRTTGIGEFLDHEFTVDNLDPFIGFTIKIVMSSTNEANVPKFRDLRAIALA